MFWYDSDEIVYVPLPVRIATGVNINSFDAQANYD